MARPRNGQVLETVKVRVYYETKEMLRTIARCRSPVRGVPATTDAEIVEELLETAFRCFEDHGADYAKPHRGREALGRAKTIAKGLDTAKKNPPHRPVGSKDKKPRRKRTK